MTLDPSAVITAHKRVAKRAYRRYGINRLELEMLLYIHTSINKTGRAIVSFNIVMCNVTARGNMKARLRQHLYFCIAKKFVGSYEYIPAPDSLCVGFTDLGAEILTFYLDNLRSLERSLTAEKFDHIPVATGIKYRLTA